MMCCKGLPVGLPFRNKAEPVRCKGMQQAPAMLLGARKLCWLCHLSILHDHAVSGRSSSRSPNVARPTWGMCPRVQQMFA